jgi:hypothetical protein
MKKILILSLALFLAITQWSCREDVTCPPFAEADLQYVPYAPGDTIRFASGQEIFELIIDELELSDDYEISCRKRNSICPCYSYAEIRAHNTFYPESASFMLLEMESISNGRLFFYNFLRMRFEFDFVSDLPFAANRPEISYFENTMINGKNYAKVIKIETFSLPDSDLSNIYLNEEYGILRFTERTNSKVWSRIPD